MNRILSLFFIGLLTFAIILFIARPELLNEIWLWLVGLSGGIIQTVKSAFDYFKKGEQEERQLIAATATASPSVPAVQKQPKIATTDVARQTVAPALQKEKIPVSKVVQKINIKQHIDTLPKKIKELNGIFDGTTLTVLRGTDDGTTTLGWLYINNRYFCYTLEDTHREEKIKHKTRIPAGEYALDFNKNLTGLTKKYRDRYDWFTYHLHIKKVPNYTGVYIHSGATHEHTSGCLLVSKGLVVTDEKTYFNQSRDTFKKLYLELSEYFSQGTKARIIYYDENWIKNLS
jgi:hypothetical protein